MAAAQIMLDEFHEPLSTHADDCNTYVLGRVRQHNVVIACLPAQQYGTINAAIVLTNMKRTFPAVRAGLIVGIGGGVPNKADVRLGDIVVGTRVMQYDLGKILEDGKYQRTAIPRTPGLLLGTAVSALRSKHELRVSGILSILHQKLEGHSEYGRPDSPDLLFHATYDHRPSSTSSCDKCDHTKLVPRDRRVSNDITIHYGAIASGNQVIKNGITRDNVARELDIICFEMEAAGLMDILPCLPIRGICDYSDSHKSKEWQRYAAATAAAYARDLIGEIPTVDTNAKPYRTADAYHFLSHEFRQRLLDSLRFNQIDSKRSTIRNPHDMTCQWLFSHIDYEAWLNPAKLTHHHGFLWISGKPGAGKSTMMKAAYINLKLKDDNEHAITASFFFNAQGEGLEKSILGMYRSLLLQLLEGYPDLQTVLNDRGLVSQSQNGCPPLNVLKDLFCNAVSALGQRSFTCFVDALDECDEQQIVEMVQYFEDLAKKTTAQRIQFRTCFSSRHYPYIFIQQGIRLTLEDQPGHTEDIATYIESRLQVDGPVLVKELRAQLLNRAAGGFMWVVLVVDILNMESRRGGMALKKKLAEIPSDLSDLFRNILRRDNGDTEALLLCILWVLYAKRPLKPQEFCHALWAGLSPRGLVDDDIPDFTIQVPSQNLDRVNRFVISSSKGLAETTNSKPPTVQFIHESVRDFLIKDKGLHELWPDLGFDCESLSHEKLKQCCKTYLTHAVARAGIGNLLSNSKDGVKLPKEYPFLEYANQHILHHANAAAKMFSQDEFLDYFPISNWTSVHNLFERCNTRKYSPGVNLFYILAEKGFSELIRTRLKEDQEIHVLGERYHYSIFAALANNNKGAVAALLNSTSSIYDGVDITEGLTYKRDLKDYKDRTPLSWAAQVGRVGIVKLLLQTRTTVDEVDSGGRTPVSRASENGHEEVVKLLIDMGANVNVSDKDELTPLLYSLRSGHEAIAKLLVDKGADLNVSDKHGWTPLRWASREGHEAAVRLLIDNGANVNARNENGWTPLQWALSNNHKVVVRLLISKGADIKDIQRNISALLISASADGDEVAISCLIDKGADVNAPNYTGWTPLLRAIQKGHEAVVRLLIDKGADVNTSDKAGWTPLLRAIQNGHKAVVRLLIDEGADVNTSDKAGWTPLLRALHKGLEAVARLLINKGVDVNASNENGWTPLIYATTQGHEAIAELLIDSGADLNASDKAGTTPLQWASKTGCKAMVRFLIDKGADVNATSENGRAPLICAAMQGHETVVGLLIDRGADINACDEKGWMPLRWALKMGHEAIARLLIDRGADINASDDGWMPRRALQMRHEAVARLRIDRDADVNKSDKNRKEASPVDLIG
ncbi:Pfs NACHT and ankyrin domain protein [Penicillium cinerascens]|uniref:Pfs NACHT and ankyrin domain protein n=1 Tax=Penicillium cinerascens TaxID=70096 RepID=A0A9W9MA60_9EURO|nr:Pfs NACHT and ankyrin domain protein [Penicillium cinerascens]KAJ5194498.1 Pfs NACHT and ankyrin domain protein [Penicillium cinerascens]